MNEELQIWYVYGLMATGVVFGGLFLWNLACAPYRIQVAKSETLERRLIEAGVQEEEGFVGLLSHKSRFLLTEAACLLAGAPLQYGDLTGPAAAFLFEIKQKVIRSEIEAHGVSRFRLRIHFAEMYSQGSRENGAPIADPPMDGVWLDRECMIELARDYGREIKGLTDRPDSLQLPKAIE